MAARDGVEAMSEIYHNKLGNCWHNEPVYECKTCGTDAICDVCHLHDEPRGECSECPACPLCDESGQRLGDESEFERESEMEPPDNG